MGKILKTKKLTTGFEALIVLITVAVVSAGVYFLAPGLKVGGSKTLEGLTINKDHIDNTDKAAQLPLPSTKVSTKVQDKPFARIAQYAWNGNSAMIVATGGPRTTQGSIMESLDVNLELVRVDQVGALRNMMVKFVDEFNSGNEYPSADKSAFGVSIMGDGVPFFITTTQQELDNKFGKGKYHVQGIGSYGLSYGEDKLIGPKIWRDNPQSMKGSVISSVLGDGDWVILMNYAFANKLKVNIDPTTYDAEAINVVPSQDDDYINSVKELIASQTTGYTIPLKEVVNGELTGKTLNKKIDGATTWTPGDKIAFDALTGFTDVVSTKDFVNQMATTLVVVKEWAMKNEKVVFNILKGTYIAANQLKLYDTWAVRASEAVAKTYDFETPKYWYTLFKGQKGEKNGLEYNIGGTRVFNYADAMQYYGITDGTNRYKSVYEQVSKYLVELNPFDFNATCKNGVVPYEDAVNLYFLKSINDIDAGTTEKVDYTETKSTVMATGEWNINFATNSSEIKSNSFDDLETIYNLLIQAENTKLKVIGHTDNTGNPNANLTLSDNRANSVVNYLIEKGIPRKRFQLVEGAGDTVPLADNKTNEGKAKNRRVQITILK